MSGPGFKWPDIGVSGLDSHTNLKYSDILHLYDKYNTVRLFRHPVTF